MSNAQIRELNKVRLEPARPRPDHDSDLESDPTDEENDDAEYEVDAICWAEYKDGSNEDGDRIGWHYYVLWEGYLKTGSDTLEMRRSFLEDPDDPNERSTALLEFWGSVPGKKVRKGRDEPRGTLGEICFASDDLLKRKFKESKPKRSFVAFKRRVEAFKKARREGFDRALTIKGDSDYYIRKKRKAQLAAEKSRAANAPLPSFSRIPRRSPEPEPVAGPSRSRRRSESVDEPLAGRRRKRSNSIQEMPPPAATPARRAPTRADESPAPALSRTRSFDSLFDESSQPSNSQQGKSATPGKPPPRSPTGSPEKRGTKRRRVVESPVSPPRATTGQRGEQEHGEMPTFELDTSIFGAPSPLVPHRGTHTPLFDFGDERAHTPLAVPAVQVEAPTPAKKHRKTHPPMRSDDPDEEEEEIEEIEVHEMPPPPAPRDPTPISFIDSEDEVAAQVDTNFAPREPIVIASSSPPGPIPTPPRVSSPPRHSPPRAASPPHHPAQPPHAPEHQQTQTPANNQRPPRAPLVIQLPPSPPRNYRALGREAALEQHREATRAAESARAAATPPAAPVPAAATAAPAAPTTPTEPRSSLPAAPASAILPAKPPTEAAPIPAPPQGPTLSVATQNAEAGPSRPSVSTGTLDSPALGSAPGRPTSTAIKLSDRPKYQQPSRIQQIDIPVDPERDPSVRHLPLNRGLSGSSQASPTAPAHVPLPMAAPVRPPAPARPPATRPPPPPPPPPVAQAPPGPPPARRTWAAQPQAPPPRPPANGQPHGVSPSWAGGTSPATGDPRQYGSFGGVSPYGGVSPHDSSNQSPYQGGMSPLNGARSPNIPAGFGGASPVYSGPSGHPGAPSGPRPPLRQGSFTGPLPPPPPQPPIAPPQQPHPQVPPTTGSYQASRDPRLRRAAAAAAAATAAPAASPVAAQPPPPPSVPPPPPAPAPPMKAPPTVASTHPLCTIRAAQVNGHPDAYSKGCIDITLRSGWSSDVSFLLEKYINAQHTYLYQPVDRRCLQIALVEGAQIVEWALVETPSRPSENWNSMQRKLDRRNILVFIDEVRADNHPVTSHNILIMARGEDSRIGTDADLNGWTLDKLKYVAFVVKVPLVPNEKVADLPNPMRPFTRNEASPPPTAPKRLDSVAASFGFDEGTAAQLGPNKTLSVIPAHFHPTRMYKELVNTADKCGIKPNRDVPSMILMLNGDFPAVTTTGLFRRTLTKETQYFSIGADLNSLISHWPMREIWKRGGLVTFSPTFFLFQHDRLADIVKLLRTAPDWAAYITPTTLLFVDEMIKKQKCLDPTTSYATLTQALFLDDNHRRLAGEMSSETGGIVVSAAPPMLALREPCAQWIDWLGNVFECTELAPLLSLCRQWARTWGHPESSLPIELVEKISMGDMIRMRNLPHVVPYRRCVYVGSINDDQSREALANGIDTISPDAFFSTYMASI